MQIKANRLDPCDPRDEFWSKKERALLTSCLLPEGSLSNQSKETARAQIPATVRERLQLSRYSETHAEEKPCGSANVCRQRVETL